MLTRLFHSFYVNDLRLCCSTLIISLVGSDFPANITIPFITSAGAAFTPYLKMVLISLTIKTFPFRPHAFNASNTLPNKVMPTFLSLVSMTSIFMFTSICYEIQSDQLCLGLQH